VRPALPGAFWRGLGWVAVAYALAAAITVAVVFGVGAGTIR
jgi:hypothetical protein